MEYFFWRFGDLKKRIALSEKKPPLAKLATIKTILPFLFAQTKSFLTTEKVKLSVKGMFFHIFPAFGSINEKN